MPQDRGEILKRIKVRLERALPIVQRAKLDSLERRLIAVIDETEDHISREEKSELRPPPLAPS